MLSPPSSYEGDIDVDIVDYETLFPELGGLDSKSSGKLSFNFDDSTNTMSISETPFKGNEENVNIVRVNVSHVCPKSEPYTAKTFDTSSHHHNYAACGEDRIGKLPKYTEFEPENGFAVCGPMSKNAVLARENRRKKKEYVTKLEGEIDLLKSDKMEISNNLVKANSTIANLNDEIEYLKSVIANETTLGVLLKNVPTAAGLNIKRGRSTKTAAVNSNSNSKAKRHKLDHDYISSEKLRRPGVCLHVAEGSVSLEFCSSCNDKSQQSE